MSQASTTGKRDWKETDRRLKQTTGGLGLLLLLFRLPPAIFHYSLLIILDHCLSLLVTAHHPLSLCSYIENPEEREEGGTPNIIGAIRCGLVYQLQAAVGLPNIAQREQAMIQTCMEYFATQPNIVVAGGSSVTNRLPVSGRDGLGGCMFWKPNS